jgi:hypothetical protein
MPTPMISSQWPRFVLPLVRHVWYQQLTAIISPVATLYGEDTSTTSVEYSQGIGNSGLVPEYNSASAEGKPGSIEYDSFSPLYEKTFTHKEYAKGLAIERKLVDDDQYGLIRRKAQLMGIEWGQSIATHQSSIFVNAFSSSYVGGDNVALCSASHPNRPSDTATTFSNYATTPFSYNAVLGGIELGLETVNDRAIPFPIVYDTLVVSPALRQKALEIFPATGKPGTADNDANALGNMRVVVDPYQGSSKSWFLVDSLQSKLHMLWYWRVRPEFAIAADSDFNLVARYRGYMRYSFGWDDWRFVRGYYVA